MTLRNNDSEAAARRVIEAYFPLFSARDATGLLGVVNFPHVRITASGTAIIASAEEWMGDPTALEDIYQRTELDSLEFVQSDVLKAHALVVFSRYDTNGRRYATYPTLWVVTNVKGKWGIQVRSSFAP